MAELPHAYPFRFVDSRRGTAPVVLPSVGAAMPGPRVGGVFARAGYPLSLAIEAMAQAVLAAPPTSGDGGGAVEPPRTVHLAGIEAARMVADVHAGDRLVCRSELQGRFGPALKVGCTLVRDGEPVAEATLLLTTADRPP